MDDYVSKEAIEAAFYKIEGAEVDMTEAEEKARYQVYKAATENNRRPRTLDKETARQAQINHNRAMKKARKPKRKEQE